MCGIAILTCREASNVLRIFFFQVQKANGVPTEYPYFVLLLTLNCNQVRPGKLDVCKTDGKSGAFIVILSSLKFTDV